MKENKVVRAKKCIRNRDHLNNYCKHLSPSLVPPVVSDNEKVEVRPPSHNKVELILDPIFLNSSNGPILEYGVLVSQSMCLFSQRTACDACAINTLEH